MDPFAPFITYFVARGEWAIAIGLALIVALALVIAFSVKARADRARASISIDAAGEGNQTTVVSDVKARGDVTIAPRQRNG